MVIITKCGRVIQEDQIKQLYLDDNKVQIIAPVNTKSLFEISRKGETLTDCLEDEDLVMSMFIYQFKDFKRNFTKQQQLDIINVRLVPFKVLSKEKFMHLFQEV